MQAAVGQLSSGSPTPFSRPGGIVERVICAVSGTEPSEWCPQQRTEIFVADQPPLPKEEDLWQKPEIDTWTGLLASRECSDFVEERFVLNVDDPWAREWIREDSAGRQWAESIGFRPPVTFSPNRECTANDPRPNLRIDTPRNGDRIINNPLSIYGQASATAFFDFWRLDYGVGQEPVQWETLERSNDPVRDNSELYEWDLNDLPRETITLRLYMESTEDSFAELKIRLDIAVPTPTPTPTQTPTPTSTATPSPTPTNTPTITPTPTNTTIPSPTITPTFPLPPPPPTVGPTNTLPPP
jgi:hypothetical protein